METAGIIFHVAAVLAVIAAFLTVTRRNPVHGAIYMIAFFVLISAQFLILRASFIAVVQVFVYAGAIMVLFVFVIMLLNLTPEELAEETSPARKILAGAFSICLFALLALTISRSALVRDPPAPNLAAPVVAPPLDTADVAGAGEIEGVGKSLFGTHVFLFEYTSILILVAILGTIYLTKKRRTSAPPPSDGAAPATLPSATTPAVGDGAAPGGGAPR